MQNPTAPTPRQLHVCFSGTLSCSGCRPCNACHEVIRRTVLIRAMMAAGFNGDARQANAFFQMHAQAYLELHMAMDRDPSIAGQTLVADIDELVVKLEELDRYRAQASRVAQEAMQAAPQYGGEYGQPNQPVPPFGPAMNQPGTQAAYPTGAAGGWDPSFNPQAFGAFNTPPAIPNSAPIYTAPLSPGPVPPYQPVPQAAQQAPQPAQPQQFPPQPILTVEHMPPRVDPPIPVASAPQPQATHQPPRAPANPSSSPNVVRITSRDPNEERVKHLVPPIAQAELEASIAAAAPKPNGVVIANVMEVPPEMRHHLENPGGHEPR